MRKKDIHGELKNLAFEFFYWFSRFEFALKENSFLKRTGVGENAEPGWDAFIEQYAGIFQHSERSQELLELNPKRQRVGPHMALEWKEVGMCGCRSDLCRIVRLLKTVRNNLFHGGKHGADGWDDPERTKKLLSSGKAILDQLAAMAGFQADGAGTAFPPLRGYKSAPKPSVMCFGEGLLTIQSKDKYQFCLVNPSLKQIIE